MFLCFIAQSLKGQCRGTALQSTACHGRDSSVPPALVLDRVEPVLLALPLILGPPVAVVPGDGVTVPQRCAVWLLHVADAERGVE